ncbi:MAG TPA: hypothetical protein VEX38_07525, partial [Fimbriimonadaceae bacterium]|nr:hypothetical protein [Fimbriimonadaceae bacterium]
DYYDSAQGYGQDPNLLYRRETDEQVYRPWRGDSRIPEILSEWRQSLGIELAVLGFCGRAYPVWLNSSWSLDAGNLSRSSHEKMWLTTEEVLEIIREAEANSRYKYAYDSDLRAPKRVAAFEGVPLTPETFRLVNAPAFLCIAKHSHWHMMPDELRVIRNPRLASLGFQRVLDPFAAFQEIAMYLGSALTAEDTAPRTVGDDRIIAQAKGFDEQSFRTSAPGQKKMQRSENRKRKRGLTEN